MIKINIEKIDLIEVGINNLNVDSKKDSLSNKESIVRSHLLISGCISFHYSVEEK